MSEILIVDDQSSNRYLLRTILEASGYGVTEASNGADALEIMARFPPKVIISDILMPQMDGFAFCRRCKKEPRFRDIPFIFCTATYTDERDRELAMQLGALRFLTKPVEPEAFLVLIQQALEERQHHEEAPNVAKETEETVFFRLYNEVLVRKLEDKMLALEESHRVLEESKRRFESMVHHTADMIVVLDKQGVVQYASPACERILGIPPDSMIGKSLLLHIHPEDRPLVEERLRSGWRVGGHASSLLEVRGLAKEGRVVDLEAVGTNLLEDPLMRALIVNVRDISERKRQEKLLRHSEEALRRRLIELEAVSNVSGALRTARTIQEMLPILLEQMVSALESEAGLVMLAYPYRDNLCAAAKGWMSSNEVSHAQLTEGIIGRVFRTGESYRTREIVSDPLMYAPFAERTPKGWGGVFLPIRVSSEVVGIVCVSVPLPREISAEEEKLLRALVEIAGTAIQRLHLHQETKTRLRQLQALHTVEQAIAASLDLRMTLQILLEQATTHLSVDAAGVLLLQPKSVMLSHAASRGFDGREYEQIQARLGEEGSGKAVLERRPILISDLRECAEFGRTSLIQQEHFVGYVAIPLIAKGQVKGVLEIFHRDVLRPNADWWSFLESLAGQAAVAIDNLQLFDGLQRSNAELMLAYDATIEGWSHALDLRDKETEGHTQRVTEMTLKLAHAVGMTDEECMHIRRGSLLHDIGKLGVPDAILHKAGPLTPEEWVIMRQHTQFAYDMLWPITYLRPAIDIPYCHHEKWDGTGYPRGLKGEQIPLSARLFAVVDVWDALRSDRPYRKGWEMERILAHIQSQSGTHFDPQAVEVFFQVVGTS